MAPYRNLKVWQHAQRLAVECAKIARNFPDYEQAGLADQLRRASYAVPVGVAGGYTNAQGQGCRESLEGARCSLAEVETILDIARDIGYVSPADYGRLEALTTETSKTLYGLIKVAGNDAGRRRRS